ncbi:MAG: hypothetical protein LBH05_05755 [Deferribacteraceae bacterium]|jgi:futalosine hydrolase|nr:hypothetical protein [Deferribacteraceae bacterium]
MDNQKYIFFVPTKKEASSIFRSERFIETDGFIYLKDVPHTVAITGIGKVNAAITLTKYLCKDLLNGSLPLLIGIAGAYRESGLSVGDVVMVRDDFFADDALLTENTIKSTDELGFPVCEGNKVCCCSASYSLPVCDANTVSLISGTNQLAQLYRNKTGASIESMEGAAFALAAASFGIKTAQVRAVSNYCGARDAQEWDTKRAFVALRNFVNTEFSISNEHI